MQLPVLDGANCDLLVYTAPQYQKRTGLKC